MKRIFVILLTICTLAGIPTYSAQKGAPPSHTNHQPSRPMPPQPGITRPHGPAIQPPTPVPTPVPVPVPPPPPPVIRQEFLTNGIAMNLGNLPLDGINMTANAGAMGDNSAIEIIRSNIGAAAAEIRNNGCYSNRFQPVSDLYEIRASNMNNYFALPVKYVIMAKGSIPNGSRLFMLVRTGEEVSFIPATTTTSYNMVMGEINSCAIYDEIALIADTNISYDMTSYMIASSLDSNGKAVNPDYATLRDNDGFAISSHIFPAAGRSNSSFNNSVLTVIQPDSSTSINVYKFNNDETVFVENLPFTSATSYSFCKIALANFEQYYNDQSISHALWFDFSNTNIEDLPGALIFRASCYDGEGIRFSTEDLMVYVNLAPNGYSSPFTNGNGSSSNPYIITSASQLDCIRDYRRCFFQLNCDIDLSTSDPDGWMNIGDYEYPFDGSFNGNGHTIRNLRINNPNEGYQGLFGYARNASIKNLRVELAPEGIIGNEHTGALCGYIDNTRIYQCYTRGTVSASDYAGGLIGSSHNFSTIRKSMSDSTVSSSENQNTTGGLVGLAADTTMTDCHVAANVSASNNRHIGGLVGQGERLKMQNCYATGTINGGAGCNAGGLIGYTDGCEIKGCIAINKRINGGLQGRIAGKTTNSSFIRCFAWEYIRDVNNKYISEGGFNGASPSKDNQNGESIAKKSFYGSGTRNKFWTVNKKVGFNLDSWIFNSGYNLPQLRSMPSLGNPDYLQ